MIVVYVYNYYNKKLLNYNANISFIKDVFKNGLNRKVIVLFVKGSMKLCIPIIDDIYDMKSIISHLNIIIIKIHVTKAI